MIKALPAVIRIRNAVISNESWGGYALVNARDLKTRKRVDKEYDLWILLSRVYHMIAKLRNMEMNKYSILPVQAYMLYIIRAMGNETTPAELSRFVYQQRSSVSDILNRMEKQGLITKEKKSDGKGRVQVKLTKKGEKALQLSEQREHLHNIMTVLNEEKRRHLESILEELRDKAAEEFSVYQKTILPPSQLSKYYQDKDLLEY
ncbi:MAG: MarR family winged helix-turn-helix transcriptional regulator [Flavisolibacter sp.]